MDEIEKAVFVENPRGYLKALDGKKLIYEMIYDDL